MPKIVSSSIVSASKDIDTYRDKNRLQVYYCLCGEFLLIVDTKLEKLPRRQTDGAYVINTKKRVHKFNMKVGPTKIVKRDKGYEKQYRHECGRCGLFVAYDQKAGLTYFLDGALRSHGM